MDKGVYDELGIKTTMNLERGFLDTLERELKESELTPYDQMYCCATATMALIQKLTRVVKAGSEKEFDFDRMLAMLSEMNKQFPDESDKVIKLHEKSEKAK